jgi:CheY-like chemotaxis protein
MRDGERTPIVLVAAKQAIINNLRKALADTNLELLHAQSKQEAIALLERTKSTIDIAIVQLDQPDRFGGWDLIREIIVVPEKPVRLIVTTSTQPDSAAFEKIKGIGFDAVVPETIPPEEWRRTVETVLLKKETLPDRPVHLRH